MDSLGLLMEEAQAEAHMQAHQRVDLGQPLMAKRIQEDWNAATNGREMFLYMFKCYKL